MRTLGVIAALTFIGLPSLRCVTRASPPWNAAGEQHVQSQQISTPRGWRRGSGQTTSEVSITLIEPTSESSVLRFRSFHVPPSAPEMSIARFWFSDHPTLTGPVADIAHPNSPTNVDRQRDLPPQSANPILRRK